MSQLFSSPVSIFIPTQAKNVAETACVPQATGWDIVNFSGISFLPDGIFISELSSDETPPIEKGGNLSDTLGEWMAVAKRTSSESKEFLVFADNNGFGSVFYSLIPSRGVVISDTFHGVIGGLEKRGIRRTLDVTTYATTLTSAGPYFQGASTNDTMAEEVKLLEPGTMLCIDPHSVAITHERVPGTALTISSYEDALDAGLDYSQRILQGLHANHDFRTRLTLSGGVDSRTVLSLLKSAEALNGLEVFSEDPRKWKNDKTVSVVETDIKIANYIREELELDWWSDPKREGFALTFLQSLYFHQQLGSNFSYQFNPIPLIKPAVKPFVTFRGGAGEMLRATDSSVRLAQSVKEEHESYKEVKTQADWFTKYLFSHGLLLEGDISERAKLTYEKYFLECRGDNFAERMNNYYFRTRNRTHFGHQRSNLRVGELSVQILGNPFFQRAAELTEFKERRNGKLVKDIFARTAPGLLQYPFENPRWNQLLSRNPSIVIDSAGKWQKSVDRNSEINVEHVSLNPEWLPMAEVLSSKKSFPMAIQNFLDSGWQRLEESLPSEQREVVEKQNDVLRNAHKQRRLPSGGLLAKLTSALDIFEPVRQGHQDIDYSTTESKKSSAQGGSMKTLKLDNREVIEAMVPYEEPLVDSAVLEENPFGFVVSLEMPNKSYDDYVYAMYLYRDGEVLARRWYQDSPVAGFSIPKEPGRYVARVFLRHSNGNARPTYSVTSTPLVISNG